MPPRAHRLALPFALAGALAAAAPPALATDPDSGGRPDDAVTLTVSGGVSLGAYEAGLSWGFIRYLRMTRAGRAGHAGLFHPRLATVTGASAGAVNALLAAALWCERPERDGGPDHNLLLDAWIDLDLAGLLPAAASGYAPGDGLLAVGPIERTGRRLRQAIFGAEGAGRYLPGCQVPLGLTVTQVEPREQDVAGLTTSTQRFVVPWRLEVAEGGEVSMRRQPLPRGELSDSVLDLAGIPGAGEVEPFRPEVVEEALLASAAVPVAFTPRRLCARAAAGGPGGPPACTEYVDGGVFDNAPMGLAVELVEAAGGGSVLHPVLSILVDPDRRRLVPPAPAGEPAASEHMTFGRQLRLFGNLLGTGRRAELARAIRSRGWNRTTQRVLRDFSAVTAELAEVHAALAQLAPPAAGAPAAGEARGEAPLADRAAFGRALSACLERLAGSMASGGGLDPCAFAVSSLRLTPAAPGAAPLPPEEVVQLADRLSAFLRAAEARRQHALGPAEATARQATFRAGSTVGAATLLFLADEVGRVAASGLPEPVLRRFRAAVLEPVRRSAGFVRTTSGLFDGLLSAELARLARVAPPAVAAEAEEARAALAELPEGALFGLGTLQGLAAATSLAVARGGWDSVAMAGALRELLTLVEARNRFAGLASRLTALQQQAAELAEGSGAENRLTVSSRFAPLAGAQLGGFAGFLDRPLRRYDYDAGLYEAAHAIAAALCANLPADAAGAVPERLPDDPSELDLASPATQRCLGQAMRGAVDALGVRASPTGRRVVARLAGMELAAWLGRSSRAQLLRAEPAWSWLDELETPSPGDPVLATLEALTATTVPCRPGDEEPLCPAELPFDAFLAALAAHGYRPESSGMALALRDQDLWWADTIERLSRRALTVERRAAGDDPSPLSAAVTTGLSAAELLARRAADRGPTPRLLLDPSTIPAAPLEGQGGWRRVAAHAVP
ncbi:MAG TPA: patatin-like phospholipase family protein, partial [Anaeromyxobacteraceae bacterium]|nr:patatin-like phospholipase family protein [Anaeromyxobacteraceae bacterium]